MKRLLLICAFCFQLSAFSATYYVSTTGNDTTGDGSIGNPWATFQKGNTGMAASDTLLARGGTYSDNGSPLDNWKSGTSSSSYTFVKNYPGETVVYQPDLDHAGIWISDKTNLWLEGIHIDATLLPGTGDAAKITTSGPLTGGNIVLTNMIFRGAPHGHGILTSGIDPALGIVIASCSIITNGWDAASPDADKHQIYLQDSNITIKNSYIHGGTNDLGGGWGIHCNQSGMTNHVYRDNFLTNCIQGILVGSGGGGSNFFVFNNVVCNGGLGLRVWSGARDVYLLNNTICSNLVANFYLDDGCSNIWVESNISALSGGRGFDIRESSNVSIQNNLGYSNAVTEFVRDYYTNGGQSGFTYANNRFGTTQWFTNNVWDAKFIAPASGNFRIGASSSAIGAGKVQSLFSTDYTGTTRTVPWDIGAYMFVGNPIVNVSGNTYVGGNLLIGQ